MAREKKRPYTGPGLRSPAPAAMLLRIPLLIFTPAWDLRGASGAPGPKALGVLNAFVAVHAVI